ncbi:hypothetical protein JTB14_010365 [Gonioctena quinquepunctata]|nr:hypothetical protein JTB14_010365 [Gonioctena quinquepunctata]
MFELYVTISNAVISNICDGVKIALKVWMNLPQSASSELLYVSVKKGAAGVLPMADLVAVVSIVQAYKILTCPKSLVHDTATSQLREVVQRRMGRRPFKNGPSPLPLRRPHQGNR